MSDTAVAPAAMKITAKLLAFDSTGLFSIANVAPAETSATPISNATYHSTTCAGLNSMRSVSAKMSGSAFVRRIYCARKSIEGKLGRLTKAWKSRRRYCASFISS